MNITPDMARDAFSPLTGREIAKVLKTWQVGLNERKVRHIMAGNEDCPLMLYYAALYWQQEHEGLTDDEYEQAINEV